MNGNFSPGQPSLSSSFSSEFTIRNSYLFRFHSDRQAIFFVVFISLLFSSFARLYKICSLRLHIHSFIRTKNETLDYLRSVFCSLVEWKRYVYAFSRNIVSIIYRKIILYMMSTSASLEFLSLENLTDYSPMKIIHLMDKNALR